MQATRADFEKEYGSGSRQDFLSQLKSGSYNDVVAIYRSNESTGITGPFDKELVSFLPKSLKYITHNGAGYDNIDIPSCTERNIQVSSTPIAVNDATADSKSTARAAFHRDGETNDAKPRSSSCSAHSEE